MDREDDVGLRDVEQVWIARNVAPVVAEALAAVGVLALHVALDQDAPGAVEDGDPPLEDLC
jgi:hypothetical protein